MTFEYTWRWFGPDDPVGLSDIKQTGATGIVTALHHIPAGRAWSREEINKRKARIEQAGLRWAVVESVPVIDDIIKKSGRYEEYLQNYKQTLQNLGECGIETVCYNFMPVVDWTRTDLEFEQPDGSTALRFQIDAMLAFELFILERKEAEEEYSEAQIRRAEEYYRKLSDKDREQLTKTIIAGLPGGHEQYTLEEFRTKVGEFQVLEKEQIREHLRLFIREVAPVAEASGVRLCIHPDDPPIDILGIPRIVSTEEDLQYVLDSSDTEANGLTFCTGSLGARPDNDLPGMVRSFGSRIHFFHFRSVQREADGYSFYEANHLEGDSRIAEVMKTFIEHYGGSREAVPIRPDHGHKMLDDRHKNTNPGYSAIGRMRGLAELRGLELGLRQGSRRYREDRAR
ncbi:MAG: mannonate dehydratase [Balneolaceae bacterium]|nr:mannonate dehydratase [Balneolaceae bacterium]